MSQAIHPAAAQACKRVVLVWQSPAKSPSADGSDSFIYWKGRFEYACNAAKVGHDVATISSETVQHPHLWSTPLLSLILNFKSADYAQKVMSFFRQGANDWLLFFTPPERTRRRLQGIDEHVSIGITFYPKILGRTMGYDEQLTLQKSLSAVATSLSVTPSKLLPANYLLGVQPSDVNNGLHPVTVYPGVHSVDKPEILLTKLLSELRKNLGSYKVDVGKEQSGETFWCLNITKNITKKSQ